MDLDPARLEACLDDRCPGLGTLRRVERIGGGQSNPTYRLQFDDSTLILRKRPDGRLLPSAHAVDREYRVQKAIAGTGVRVPRMRVLVEDAAVLGTTFYVMDHVPGVVGQDSRLPGRSRADRSTIYNGMAGMLAQIHAVDIAARGLSDFGRHGGFFRRQIALWTRQIDQTASANRPRLTMLADWLDRHCPGDDTTTLIHGDYRVGNLILHQTAPRIEAVLDWELSTLGHPLADLAHTCVFTWMIGPDEYGGLAGADLDALGLPSMGDFAEAYARASGRRDRLERFHLVFALFRNAVLFDGIADRANRGNAAADNAATVGRLAPRLADRAAALIDGAAPDLP
jgi:aminoglycoside phosphotransferase (APT) family kinase protein